MYLFFDTETNGLPKNYKASMHEVDNWPRVIQLGWIFLNDDLTTFSENRQFIKPDGWVVPKEKFWIDQGYSTERCEKEGLPMKIVMQMLINDINRTNYMVAHNLAFDYKVLGAEMIRLAMSASKKTDKFCTMEFSTNICKIPNTNRYGGYKWPKLEELHRFLFDEDFIGAHDALSDCHATMKCFVEMKKRNLITI